jgi:uncharacterized membrane protein YidH (DUF202 family)
MPEPVVPDTRFTLALERTLLAWIRTALALMGLGFVVARLPLWVRDLNSIGDPTFTTPALSRAIGVGLVCLAVLVQVIALYEYQRNSAKVMRGETLIPTLWSAVVGNGPRGGGSGISRVPHGPVAFGLAIPLTFRVVNRADAGRVLLVQAAGVVHSSAGNKFVNRIACGAAVGAAPGRPWAGS